MKKSNFLILIILSLLSIVIVMCGPSLESVCQAYWDLCKTELESQGETENAFVTTECGGSSGWMGSYSSEQQDCVLSATSCDDAKNCVN